LDRNELAKIERVLHLRHNKWDTQVGDVSVLSEQPLVLPCHEWNTLCRSAEQLAIETMSLESILLDTSPECSSIHVLRIGVPRAIWDALASIDQRRPGAATPKTRVMRFDFHPTKSGWRVSEVNSDVPGGWREGTSLPLLFGPFYTDLDCPPSPLNAWGEAIQPLVQGGHVALLSAPGHLEDEQVVRTFMGELHARRIPCTMIQNPAALEWRPSHGCTLRASGEPVSVVIRFYQAEWLCALPERTGWKKLLHASEIVVVNPTISAVSESKRFALAFNDAPGYPAWSNNAGQQPLPPSRNRLGNNAGQQPLPPSRNRLGGHCRFKWFAYPPSFAWICGHLKVPTEPPPSPHHPDPPVDLRPDARSSSSR
jgi:hypothetical protein